jgi:hypothetical protein
MHVFIAGIMQGSRQDEGVEVQAYRVQIAEALKRHVPGAEIVDPWQIHPASPSYTDEEAARTFLTMTAKAGEVDVVIAYLPHASMGTAIEMWTAYHAGKPIVVVSPLQHNWVIRLCAHEVLPDMESLLTYIADGRLSALVDAPTP